MFAVIKVSGLQHIIKEGDIIKVNKIDATPGSEFIINEILAKGTENNLEVGNPYIENAKVIAKVLEQTKDKKVIIFKKKRRHNYRKKIGFRQSITKLEITNIQ